MTAHSPTAQSTSRESLSSLRESIDGRGGDITVHIDDPWTMLAVTGEIDAANVAELSAVLDRFTASECRLVVDLRGIGFLGVQGLRALNRFDENCCRSGAAWVLVAGPTVQRLLGIVGWGHHLPTADSIATAARLLQSAAPGSAPNPPASHG